MTTVTSVLVSTQEKIIRSVVNTQCIHRSYVLMLFSECSSLHKRDFSSLLSGIPSMTSWVYQFSNSHTTMTNFGRLTRKRGPPIP